MAKANVGERRDEPGIEDVFAALETAARSTRAECARLADERKQLTSEIRGLTVEIGELKAARDEEQRKLTELHGLTGVEFLKRCVAGGIDKKTIEEVRAELRSALAEVDETLSRTNKKESLGGDTKL